jgi:hypothetical protein
MDSSGDDEGGDSAMENYEMGADAYQQGKVEKAGAPR